MSAGRWKALLVALSLVSIAAMGIEALSAVAAFERGVEGLWGVKRVRVMHDGRAAFVVREFTPWSLAPQSGLRVGDVFVPDHWYDADRPFVPGESVAGTIVRDGASWRTEIATTPRPIEGMGKLHFFLNAGLCGLGIFICLAIGFRQPDRQSSRALAMAFLWFSTNLGDSYSPPLWPLVFVRAMNSAAFLPGWYFLLWFAIHYPDGSPTGWRRGLRRLLPLFLFGALVGATVYVAAALGRVVPDAAGTAYLVYVGAAGPLTLAALWDGWRRSSGVSRQRFTWLLGGFALFLVASYSSWLNWLVIGLDEQYVNLFSVLGSLAMYVGLSYAILRHRVLDMGLALNRSLVFAVVGAVLLGTFHLLQVVTARLLHFDDPAKAGLVSGLLAVLVVLAFPKVKPKAEWLIDRLFYRDWVAREADLARFTADARGYSEAASLTTALVEAVDRFTGGAGATFYVRANDGRFASRSNSSAAPPSAAPPVLDADEPIVVALRAGRSVVRCDEVHSALPGELAIVASRPRDLDAFVLIHRRRDGVVLRSDEVDALRASLHAIGVAWQSLRWDALQRELVRTNGAAG